MYIEEELRKDISELDEQSFFIKYFVRSDNWYFENVLNIPQERQLEVVDDFREIVCSHLGIAHYSIALVGSAKIGLSLSPLEAKTLKPFSIDGKDRKQSDLDIAIISSNLFNTYWELLRMSYRLKYEYRYKYIKGTVFRGYISGVDLEAIPGCRQQWREQIKMVNSKLVSSLYIRHPISYRIYRSWQDLEDYQTIALRKLRKGDNNDSEI